MFRWLCSLAIGAVLCGFAFLLLTGQYINDGPVLVTVSRNHGVHVGDVFIVGGWAVGMIALLALTVMRSRRS